MSNRKHNFSAGPCTLPLSVLEEAQTEFVDYQGAGMSLIEMSHRGKHFDDCLLYTSPSPRDGLLSRMPSSA